MKKQSAINFLVEDVIERLSYEVGDGNFCGLHLEIEAAFELCFIGKDKCRTSSARVIVDLVGRGLERLQSNDLMADKVAEDSAALAAMVDRLSPWDV